MSRQFPPEPLKFQLKLSACQSREVVRLLHRERLVHLGWWRSAATCAAITSLA
jgi:hypothetical protein